MEGRLRNDYTAHYGEGVSATANISQSTNQPYFELEDTAAKELVLHYTVAASGMAVFRNTPAHDLTIINYDKFLTGLSHAFQQGRKRADAIIYTTTNTSYFLLGELKDRNPNYNSYKTKATEQLSVTLTTLLAVQSIKTFTDTYTVRRCCIFNKQAVAPAGITATQAFGRVNQINPNGLKLVNPVIEGLGFELYEYAGRNEFVMT